MRRRWLAASALLCVVAGATARAERPRRVELRLARLPALAPTTLTMRKRVRVAAAQPIPPTPARAVDDRRSTSAVRQAARRELVMPGQRLDEKIIFRFNFGFGIDGGQPSTQRLLSGYELDEQNDYDRLRSYGFGDLVLGTRGLVFPSLGTYFASEFRFDQDIGKPTQAVPSVHYQGDIQNALVRSAYAEAQGFFKRRWLRPLYFRAGRQFKYGVSVAHFDGLVLGYDTRPVHVSLWFGSRVSLYGLGQDPTDPQEEYGGTNLRVDLSDWTGIPLVFTTDTIDFGGFGHRDYGIAYRWKPDILFRASARQLDSHFARETLSVWARLSEVTTLTAEIDNRTSDDWIYDLIVFRPPSRTADPRTYLNMGPPLPRLQLDVRAGTVVLRNLDVLLRGAAAFEHDDDEDAPYSPSYLEAGAALEVRLRRNIRLGSSFTARRYGRDPVEEPPADEPMTPDPLPELGNQVGELSFYEGGFGVDYSVGARRFSASGELYGRMYDRQSLYQPEPPIVDELDLRTGGRFSVEGWANNRLRVKAEYDVSISDIDMAPELRGIKSLRVLAEGSF
jgi:hypothetical protein